MAANEISISVKANNQSAAGFTEAEAAARAGGEAAGKAFTEGLQQGEQGAGEATMAMLEQLKEAAAAGGTESGMAFAAAQEAAISEALAAGFSNEEIQAQLAEMIAQFEAAGVEARTALASGVNSAIPEFESTAEAVDYIAQNMGESFAAAYGLMRDGLASFESLEVEFDQEFRSMTVGEIQQLQYLSMMLEEVGVKAADAKAAITTTEFTGQGSGGINYGESLDSVAPAAAEAETALSDVGKTVEKTTGSFGGMASMMYGPWGMAIYAGMMLLPVLGSAFSDVVKAFEPTKAITLDVTALGNAIAADGTQAATATAALVAQSSVTDGIATSAKQAGVSIATWTEAVMGNVSAQLAVTDAVGKLNQSQLNAAVVTQANATSTGKFSDEQRGAQQVALSNATATNQLTDANQKLLNSMAAQNAQIVQQIQKQTELNQATLTLDTNSQIMAATMADVYAKMQLTSQQSAINSVALLNLGASQNSLNQELVAAETAYSESTSAAGAYSAGLTALYGQYGDASQAQATFTTGLSGLSGTITKGTDAVDLNTAAGAKNFTAFEGVAKSAEAAATAIYQQTQDSGKANSALQEMAGKLDTAASKAGLTKEQVRELNIELFGVPSVKDITFFADTNPAHDSLQKLLSEINSSHATVTVYENSSGQVFSSGGRNKANAYGGITAAAVGGPREGRTLVGEYGPELVDVAPGSMVTPNSNVNSMAESGGWGGGGGVQKVQLEFVGSSSDPLWTLLKEHIRFVAGNGPNSVQVALGQAY